MGKYLVQAILIAGVNELVTDSIKTDDYKATLDFVMKRHKASNKYLYIAMEIETQKEVFRTDKNKYFLW